MSLTRTAIRQTSGLTLISNLNFGIKFIAQIILARLLTPEIFGIVTLAATILGFLSLISMWGIDTAIMQEEGTELPDTLFTLTGIYFIAGLIVFSGILYILKYFYDPVIIKVGFILLFPNLLNTLSSVSKSIMHKKMKLTKMGFIEMSSIFLASLFAIITAVSGWGLWSLVSFYFLINLIRSCGFLFFSSYKPKFRINKEKLKWFFSFGGKIFQSSILGRVINQGDDIAVGSIAGSDVLGVYNMAWKLTKIFHTVIIPPINKTVLATFSKSNISLKNKRKAFEFATRSLFRVVLPFYFLLGTLRKDIINLILGEKWINSSPLVLFLIPWGILLPYFAINKHFHYAVGKPENYLFSLKIMFSIFIILIIPGVYYLEAKGAVLVLNLVFLIGTVLLYFKTKYILNTSVVKNIENIVFSFTISGIILLALIRYGYFNSTNYFLNILVSSLIYGTLYIFLLFLTDKKLKYDIKKTRNAFISKK